jgi:hypothetical protein
MIIAFHAVIRSQLARLPVPANGGNSVRSTPPRKVMTHIDVGDDNSTPEQNMVRADKVELSQAF